MGTGIRDQRAEFRKYRALVNDDRKPSTGSARNAQHLCDAGFSDDVCMGVAPSSGLALAAGFLLEGFLSTGRDFFSLETENGQVYRDRRGGTPRLGPTGQVT